MKIKNQIRVILADDHAFIRRGIRRILEKNPNILVIGEAGTGEAALRLVQELKPDVLVLDLEMPDMTGTLVAEELRRRQVPVSIVILSACDDEYFIRQTLQVGVDGYINKSESPSKITEAIYRLSEKYVTASASVLLFLIPKLVWLAYQAVNTSWFDINLM